MIYLDHAATTPMRPGVWEAMSPYASDVFGNSSGIHGISRRAKNALEEAREQIAALIGADHREVVFTSGGTESDNLAIKGVVFSSLPRAGLVTVATEHEAVLETAYFLDRLGHPVTIVGVDSEGRVSPDRVVEALTPITAVVSVMLVNNETGTLQDVAAIARAVHEADPEVMVHTDAVQAVNSEEIDVGALGVDLASITAHKFGGPKGAGILYVRSGTPLEPVLHGGGQELGRRSGTHDVAGAVGFATALEAAVADRERFRAKVGAIRDDFEKRLLAAIPDAVVNTPAEGRSSHHLNLRFPGVHNESLLMRLDQAGVAASAGSACASGAATVSHVLEAMGLSAEEARESIRFSFGWNTTAEEAEQAAGMVVGLVEELR
ncbi:MAG: cysteine desulfurase family protein [Acidimicrobiia bacterium]